MSRCESVRGRERALQTTGWRQTHLIDVVRPHLNTSSRVFEYTPRVGVVATAALARMLFAITNALSERKTAQKALIFRAPNRLGVKALT